MLLAKLILESAPVDPAEVAVGLLVASYLVGSLPFGYLVGRLKGVDLFTAGSGNIGATNAGRVLGRGYGLLVFVLDLLKGAIPVAVADPLARALHPAAPTALGAGVLPAAAAVAAFVGHLFPVFLAFRGGKGVATGAGTVLVLAAGPAGLAVLTWAVVVLASRTVSLASIAAVGVLAVARVAGTPEPFGPGSWPASAYCVAGAGLVIVKHRANLGRLAAGTENRIGDGPMRHTLLRAVHVLAVGFWFGGAGFFNFVAAPAIFEAFKQVVAGGPSDRTAGVPIVPADAPQPTKDALASALAGAAVGPIFPRYFLMQAVCGGVALVTALAWWRAEPGRRVHRWRVVVLGLAVALVAAGWPVSQAVSDLRLARFDPDPAVASAARAAFGPWHLVSLGLSLVTTCLAGVGLAMAAKLPEK